MIDTPQLRSEVTTFLTEHYGGMLHSIVGRSMWPILREGMLVRVEPLSGEAVPGDILVYRTSGTLIAHRLLRHQGSTAYRICGDAVPATIEEIAKVDIIGRVSMVWPTGKISDPACSDSRLRFWGNMMVVTHPLRANIAKMLHLLEAFLNTKHSKSGDFYRLVEATLLLRRGEKTRVHEIFAQGSMMSQLRCIGRHAMGAVFASAWGEGAEFCAASNAPFENELRKTRIITSLWAPLILKRVQHLLEVLHQAEIPYILLKGAARLASGALEAQRHHSTDVDVLIPLEAIDQAEQALMRAGYVARIDDPKKRDYYLRFEHHRPPLWPPNERVPIELHTEIARPGTVSQHFDFAALRPYAIKVEGELGAVWVLNAVGSAVHLAYHARKLQPWRDITLLADLLASMTAAQREVFDAIIQAERKHAIPLQSAVVAADALNGRWHDRPATRWYLNWVMEREELPLILKHRSGVVEGLMARVGVEITGTHNFFVKVIRWVLNMLAVPWIVLWCARNSGGQMLRRWSLIRRNAQLDKRCPNIPHVVFNDVQ